MRPLASVLAQDAQVSNGLDRLPQSHLVSADCPSNVLLPEQQQKVDTDELVWLEERGAGSGSVTGRADRCNLSLHKPSFKVSVVYGNLSAR